jgi:iron complex transport system substrate-binding protein
MKRELFHSRSIERVMKWPARCASSAASFLWIGIATGLWLLAHSSTAGAVEPEGLPRLISLNPSLTAIVFRLGAGEALVGVDDYSTKLLAEAAGLPRVGGLFDPSLEAVVALQPDRVLIVAGIDQQSHAERLARLGLKVDIYQNERLDQVLENITRLGRLVGREDAAAARIRSIVAMRSAVAKATRGRPRPTTLAIVDRSPLYLVGGETFLDEMLEAVGANNLGRTLTVGYPRASIEWLIAARPELLLDMTPGAEGAASFWSRWPSLPAVSSGRVMTVEASRVSLPGPDLDLALRELAVAVHGPAIDAAIDAALSDEADEAPSAAGDRAVPFAPARAVPRDLAVEPSRPEVTP